MGTELDLIILLAQKLAKMFTKSVTSLYYSVQILLAYFYNDVDNIQE